MPKLTLALTDNEPVFECLLAMGRAQETAWIAGGRQVPQPVSVKCLIDTGSEAVALDHKLVERLALKALGVMAFTTGAETKYTTCYSARFIIPTTPEPTVLDDIQCIAVRELSGVGFQALVGRVVLEHFRLELDGPEKTLTLHISREATERSSQTLGGVPD